jgi:hypothetical protein
MLAMSMGRANSIAGFLPALEGPELSTIRPSGRVVFAVALLADEALQLAAVIHGDC